MDKQKQIEKMAKTINNTECLGRNCFECEFNNNDQMRCMDNYIAMKLINVGYGNLKDFVEWLKTKSMTHYDWNNYIDIDDLDELLKEYTE